MGEEYTAEELIAEVLEYDADDVDALIHGISPAITVGLLLSLCEVYSKVLKRMDLLIELAVERGTDVSDE